MVSKRMVRRGAAALAVAAVAAVSPLGTSAGGAQDGSRYGTPLSPRLQALAASASADRSIAAESRTAGVPAEGPGSLLRTPDDRLLVNLRVAAVD
ncbi:MAG: hypothetical protein KDB04_17385, partial [Acidimicrobiales bacterium]|nr:hypothetical protein [Acidimicrobiales bacterium]